MYGGDFDFSNLHLCGLRHLRRLADRHWTLPVTELP
jgi:hypothetical protein